MPPPATREELTLQLASSFERLELELDRFGKRIENVCGVGDWTIKDLLAIRIWWTASVADWIDAGWRGEHPVTPAEGYLWSETPWLNADVAASAKAHEYNDLRDQLRRGVRRVESLIAALEDQQLLNCGVFPWAGKWPLARWIAINTTRQYTTARTYVRRANRAFEQQS